MALLDLGGTEQPIDPMLVKAIETAFLSFSLPTVPFVPAPRAWKECNPKGRGKGPTAVRKAEIKLKLIERDGFQCAYCAREFVDLDDATLDHVIPNCVVGHWKPWNLLLACGPCNNVKGDNLPLVLAPMLLHLVHTLGELTRWKHESCKPIPTDGYPSKSAAKRARRARAQVRRQIESLSGVPFRLAIEAAPVRAELPAGQDGQ